VRQSKAGVVGGTPKRMGSLHSCSFLSCLTCLLCRVYWSHQRHGQHLHFCLGTSTQHGKAFLRPATLMNLHSTSQVLVSVYVCFLPCQVIFHPFSQTDLQQTVEMELSRWASRAKERHGIELTWTPGLVESLTHNYDERYGYR
jgi:hypothetical protein